MKKIIGTLISVLLLVTSTNTAHAWTTSAPTWASDTGAASDFSWDYWIQCDSKYREYDCIDSVYWLKSDGTIVQGTWVPAAGFDYSTQQITWVKDGNDSAQYFQEPIQRIGFYQFSGLVTPCNDNVIYADVRPAHYTMQVNAQSSCSFLLQQKFEEKFQFTLKSKHLKGLIGGISSNGKDPDVSFVEKDGYQFISVSAAFAKIPWNDAPGGGISSINFCEKNMGKAGTTGWGLWTGMFYLNMSGNDDWLAQHPGDLITGTNGWNCGGNMQWDQSTKSLVMQVGAPHFNTDGSVTEGWFEGRIKAAMIKSKYGINPAQAAVSAKLEIIYDAGDKKVATMTTTYDPKTDWLYLKAYGFEYSNPQLRLTFGSKTSSAGSSTNKVVRPVTITCVKGKVIKKVTAANPTCPTGYKRK